ncbi:LysR substrate-binding domain-containing protein [Lacisediminimonas sp.]|uniref:LysR substrate-binding domain-containing protein n=1 Tax=Lacisediminimonas sp. TaxID=3060582 RepID=UPI0027246AC5|nr:LysR substrate-binding domain-containing protein [Lacisediminimonas sp.]MDO8299814.1 LysR substrate-binding domain-containing protein [Lacisediminimonas sp.]
MNRIPPVHALSAFEAAARLGSFASAANQLCITPSALSHRIRLLEEMVGERLFVREGRTLSLSGFGRSYLDVVRQALRVLTDFPVQPRETQDPSRVKITLPPSFARYMMMPRLAEFRRQHPSINLEIYLSVPLYDLSLSESDVEVRFGAGDYPELLSEKLLIEPAFAVASPDYLAGIAPLRTPEDLRHASLVRSGLEPWQPWFKAAGLDWPEPSTGVRVDDLGLLLELIRHGHGVGLTRDYFARDMLASGEVVRLFDLQLTSPPHVYYMVYRPGSTERPQVAQLIDWMRSVFRNV